MDEEQSQTPSTEVELNPPEDLGLDSLYDQAVDIDGVERAEADALLPGGSYQTVPVLTVAPYETKTGPNAGRMGFRFYGEVASRKPLSRSDGQPPQMVSGRLGFRMSNERRNKNDGTPDSQYRLWMNAVRAFKIAAGYDPSTNREVVDYVKNYPVGLRVGQVGVPTEQNPNPEGEPGNAVFSIFPLRDQ